jgi:esterase/lipase
LIEEDSQHYKESFVKKLEQIDNEFENEFKGKGIEKLKNKLQKLKQIHDSTKNIRLPSLIEQERKDNNIVSLIERNREFIDSVAKSGIRASEEEMETINHILLLQT